MLARVSTALAVVAVAVAVARAGVPFQVNTTTPGNQTCPRIAAGAAGNFVVTWSNSFNDMRGQRFGADLTPIGSEFVVHPVPLCPAVSADAAGNFVLAWTDLDSDLSGIMARRFDSTGAPLGGAFQVNTYTTGRQREPAVAMDASGAFAVVWQGVGENEDAVSGGIFGQRFDAAGAPVGGEFHVNTYTTMYQVQPAIAARPDGDFVVVWVGRIDFGQGILGQRFDAAGTPVGGEFSVNEFDPTSPAVDQASCWSAGPGWSCSETRRCSSAGCGPGASPANGAR